MRHGQRDWGRFSAWATLLEAAAERETRLWTAASRAAQMVRHHRDCEPLSRDGCRCGLWELQNAVVDIALSAGGAALAEGSAAREDES